MMMRRPLTILVLTLAGCTSATAPVDAPATETFGAERYSLSLYNDYTFTVKDYSETWVLRINGQVSELPAIIGRGSWHEQGDAVCVTTCATRDGEFLRDPGVFGVGPQTWRRHNPVRH